MAEDANSESESVHMVVATKRRSVTNCGIRVVEELTDLATLGNSYMAALGSERFAIDVLKKVDEFVHQATIELGALTFDLALRLLTWRFDFDSGFQG